MPAPVAVTKYSSRGFGGSCAVHAVLMVPALVAATKYVLRNSVFVKINILMHGYAGSHAVLTLVRLILWNPVFVKASILMQGHAGTHPVP